MNKKIFALVSVLSFSFSLYANSSLSYSSLKNTAFKLESLHINSSSYVANCTQDEINENIFARDSRKLRSEYGLVSGAHGYFFDDLQACTSLNFTALLLSKVDFKANKMKIKIYEASWRKKFGFHPIQVMSIWAEQELTANCTADQKGIFFKKIHLRCVLKDNENRPSGVITFIES